MTASSVAVRARIEPARRPARHRVALRCVPAHDLEPLRDADELRAWRAVDSDPQFTIDLCEGGCPSGWYRFEVALIASRGRLSRPCLYLDDGSGFHQDRCELLAAGRCGDIFQCIVFFSTTTFRLRLDPSTVPCEFSVGNPSLQRIGRLQAASLLLHGLDVHDRETRLRACLDSEVVELDVHLQNLAAETGVQLLNHGESNALGYPQWIEAFDNPTIAPVDATRRGVAEGADASPLISVLVPVYNTPDVWLQRCIDSVRRQSYPNWELCIADDASTAPGVRTLLEAMQAADPRIRVTFRERNGHISAASNSALSLAEGAYVALLDHDDELHPHALHHIAEAIRANPDAGLIYSDEDKIDATSARFDPYFKPDWNPDLLLGHNMISHLGVYRTGLVRELGGFREGYEGSQDYDLALRCIERLQPRQIHHIPHVLYHWRAIAGSTALAAGEKDYASNAAIRAIEDHLSRTKTDARVSHCDTSRQYRVRYALPQPAPLVSLIVPTRDQHRLLSQCIDSLLHRTDYSEIEVLIVDNQSTQPESLAYLDRIDRHSRVRVLRYDAPFNYSAINNFALRHANGSVIGLINNDIEVIDEGWLQEMVSHACRREIGAVGAKLYYPDGTIQHAGVILGIHGVAAHPYSRKPADHSGYCNRARLVQNLSAVTAACLVVRKSVYDEVGGLDEALAVAFNDVDFCLRVGGRGYRNLWTPYARLVHHESVSRGADVTPEKRARFVGEVEEMRRRWGKLLDADPAYNPNLTRSGEPFELDFRGH